MPLIVLLWILNPVGGQTSLRAVKKASNYTIVDTPFVYYDRDATPYSPIPIAFPPFVKAATSAFNMALFSPSTSKNGTQDLFGNVQIPMLEDLRLHQEPDVDGWYTTIGRNLTGAYAALATALDVPKSTHKLVYSSLVGLPFVRNDSFTQAQARSTNSTDDTAALDPKLQAIKQDLFGDDLVNIKQLFNVETSYLNADCSVQNVSPSGPSNLTYDNYLQSNLSNWANSTSVVSNGQGLAVDFGSTHNVNSTDPRRIGFESWLAFDSATTSTNLTVTLSEAWCNLTTTYIEAQVYCMTERNCTVSKVRASTKPRSSSSLTVLDGITHPTYAQPDSPLNHQQDEEFQQYAAKVAPEFFQTFLLATANETRGPTTLTPLESYFADPVTPFRSAIGDSFTETQTPLYDISDQLFSTRFSQLLDTWMLAAGDPYTLTGGIDIAAANDDTSIALTQSSNGQISVEKTVLRCHKIFFAILVIVSTILFGMGLATAYLDATRKGPDVLDDFVNSIRHSPYVHVEQGPSMEDGQDKARRLKNTVIQMGDVKPDDAVGYVAIGTPNARQPVERLDHTRHYHWKFAFAVLLRI